MENRRTLLLDPEGTHRRTLKPPPTNGTYTDPCWNGRSRYIPASPPPPSHRAIKEDPTITEPARHHSSSRQDQGSHGSDRRGGPSFVLPGWEGTRAENPRWLLHGDTLWLGTSSLDGGVGGSVCGRPVLILAMVLYSGLVDRGRSGDAYPRFNIRPVSPPEGKLREGGNKLGGSGKESRTGPGFRGFGSLPGWLGNP